MFTKDWIRSWVVHEVCRGVNGSVKGGIPCGVVSVLLLGMGIVGHGWSLGSDDPWHVMESVSASPAQPMISGGSVDGVCPERPLSVPLGLFEAVERALCSNPKTKGAWADVKASAEAVGVAKAAYLPTLNGSVQYIGEHIGSQIINQPSLDSPHNEHVGTQTLSLNWVLFDFGGRSANLESAEKLLAAAQASQNVALQTAYINAAKDYYAAVSGLSRVQAMQRVENDAHDSFMAASLRMEGGAANVTDMLQSKTAYTMAEYNRVKAEATYRSALGSLAVDMGLAPDILITMPNISDENPMAPKFITSIHELIEEAERQHPTVLEAQAQWESAQAKVRSIQSEGLPTLSLVAESSRNNQPTSVQLGSPELPAVTRDNYLGIKLDVPLFEGQARGYKVRQAQAQADSQREAMHDAEHQVATAIWTNYQDLLANGQNLDITHDALDAAQQAFIVMQTRYKSGMANILELLNTQQALAKAEEQHVEAQTDWYTSKLQLAASLGNIDLVSASTYE